MKHTKGIWEVNSHEHGSHKTISKGANNICIVLLGNLSDGSSGEANARLIAASPTMYEALKEFKTWYQTLSHMNPESFITLKKILPNSIINKLEQAIQKAGV